MMAKKKQRANTLKKSMIPAANLAGECKMNSFVFLYIVVKVNKAHTRLSDKKIENEKFSYIIVVKIIKIRNIIASIFYQNK